MKSIDIKLLALVIVFLFSSCAKEESRISPIPSSRVDVDINLILEHQFNNPFYTKMYHSNQDGVRYAGYAGVLVISNAQADWVYAYDLCCPYEAPQINKIEMHGSFKAKCPACESVFNLLNEGRAESGPAQQTIETAMLKNYTVMRGNNSYRIYN